MKLATGRDPAVLKRIEEFCGIDLEKTLPTDPGAIEVLVSLKASEALTAEVLWRNIYKGAPISYVERYVFSIDSSGELHPLLVEREEDFSLTRFIPMSLMTRTWNEISNRVEKFLYHFKEAMKN